MLRNAVTRYWQGYLTYGALLVLTGILAIAYWLSWTPAKTLAPLVLS